MATGNTEAPAHPTRRPKSELDREIKLLTQIDSRFRALSLNAQELCVDRMVAELAKRKAEATHG
jgi:hypothetical protein